MTTKPAVLESFRRHSSQVSGKWHWVAASGVKGVSEVNVLLDKVEGTRTFTLRLVFAEPERLAPGQRVFNVEVQGRAAIKDLDIVKEAGGPLRAVVREISGVQVEDMPMASAGKNAEMLA